ncbi:MAG TPA: cellulose biosynthesis protein BcsS [Caulobacteraceae bacterium]|nr:cellulose biosynthesis protein BcsS [Caulobacteraceae bacterium]
MALLVMMAAFPTRAAAQEQTPDQGKDLVVVSGGVDIDVATFGYGGATFAVPGFSIGQGPAVRVSGFGGVYSFNSGGGPVRGKVDARFGGGEGDVLYQFSSSNLWVNLGAGARYVDTTFSPKQPTNRRRGAQWEPALVIDGGAANGPWRGDWFASYGTTLSDYEVRASLTHTVTSNIRLGLEGETDGDPTYEEERVGPYAGLSLARNAEIQVSAGVSAGSARSTGAYGRLGFYAGF